MSLSSVIFVISLYFVVKVCGITSLVPACPASPWSDPPTSATGTARRPEKPTRRFSGVTIMCTVPGRGCHLWLQTDSIETAGRNWFLLVEKCLFNHILRLGCRQKFIIKVGCWIFISGCLTKWCSGRCTRTWRPSWQLWRETAGCSRAFTRSSRGCSTPLRYPFSRFSSSLFFLSKTFETTNLRLDLH